MTRPTSPEEQELAKKKKRRRKHIEQVVVTVVAGIILAVLGFVVRPYLPGADSNSDSTAAGSTSTAESESQPSAKESEASLDAGSATPTSSLSPLTADERNISLDSDLVTTTESCHRPGNSGYSWRSGAPLIAGDQFTDGFSCLVGPLPVSGYVDVLVPITAQTFTATVGIVDTTDNTTPQIQFDVVDVVSGSVLESHTVGFGQQATFATPVADSNRIRLLLTLLSGDGLEDTGSEAAWASPRFA